MLEAIVASGIIVTAVSAALTLVQSSINGAKSSEEQIVAYSLARESIEVVRQIRDSNWLAGRDYDENIIGPGYILNSIPTFDPETSIWQLDFGDTDWDEDKVRVYKQTVIEGGAPVGLYRQAAVQPDGTVATRFRRLINLKKLCSNPAGSTANFIDYNLYSDSQPCPAGTENVGFEVNSHVRWDRPGGGEYQVHVIERMFDWR